jgi:hypothetical protein
MLTTSSQASEYLPLALRCRSKNEFNLLHIAYENILAPIEFSHFMDLVLTQQLPQRTYEWLRKIAELSPGLYDSPQGFRREILAENVVFYRNPSDDAAAKSLLVGFTGNARRLMMPIAIFLQCLDSRVWDVLLLRKGMEQKSYSDGVHGVADSFPTLIEYVQTAVCVEKYGRVVTYGTSGGGFSAILAAVLMRSARGISVCGASPSLPPEPWLASQLAVLRTYPEGSPHLRYFYGANSPSDIEAALSLQSLFGGELHPVAGVDDHYALKPMLKAGEFPAFLNEVLG